MIDVSGISRENRRVVEDLHRAFSEPFTAAEAAERLDLDPARARRLTRYLADRGWLDRVRRGVYLPVPLDSHQPGRAHMDPWEVGSSVFEPAYIAGWSAAEHWDLTEQIFRSVLMATARRPRDRNPTIGGTRFVLHTVPTSKHVGLVPVWRGGSRVHVTDPARTIVDVLADPSWGGGIRLVSEMLDEYLHRDDRDDNKLVEYGDLVGNGAMFKRLGYLLERTDPPADALVHACRDRRSSGINDLDPSVNAGGPILSAWGIRRNVDLGRTGARAR
ncbi:MAG: hypothetical protein OXI48_02415 [bacterium]|nr:hypothetical protein [bacterium]